jgi:hypothetical protein
MRLLIQAKNPPNNGGFFLRRADGPMRHSPLPIAVQIRIEKQAGGPSFQASQQLTIPASGSLRRAGGNSKIGKAFVGAAGFEPATLVPIHPTNASQ